MGHLHQEKRQLCNFLTDSRLTDAFNDESNLFFFVQVLGPELGTVRLEVRDLARSHRQHFLSLCPQAT